MSRIVRHLPVLGQDPAPPLPRPAWHWVLIGTGLIFCLWLPLIALAGWLAGALSSGGSGPSPGPGSDFWLLAGSVAPFVTSILIAWCGGTYVVARFGGMTQLGHGALAGLLASSLAWACALGGGALAEGWMRLVTALVLLPSGSALAALGAWRGRAETLPPGGSRDPGGSRASD